MTRQCEAKHTLNLNLRRLTILTSQAKLNISLRQGHTILLIINRMQFNLSVLLPLHVPVEREALKSPSRNIICLKYATYIRDNQLIKKMHAL